MDRWAWQATYSPWGTKSRTRQQLSQPVRQRNRGKKKRLNDSRSLEKGNKFPLEAVSFLPREGYKKLKYLSNLDDKGRDSDLENWISWTCGSLFLDTTWENTFFFTRYYPLVARQEECCLWGGHQKYTGLLSFRAVVPVPSPSTSWLYLTAVLF